MILKPRLTGVVTPEKSLAGSMIDMLQSGVQNYQSRLSSQSSAREHREESARRKYNGTSLRKMKAFQKSNNLFMSVSQGDLEHIEFPNNDAMNVSPKMAHLAGSAKRNLK